MTSFIFLLQVKKNVNYLIRLAVFWLIWFAIFRIGFLISFRDMLPKGHMANSILSLVGGYKLDLSTVCYFIVLPFLLWSVHRFYSAKWLKIISDWYTYILIVITSILSVANIYMFGKWGTLLDARAFIYVMYPKEMLSFIDLFPLIMLLLAWILLSMGGIYLYRKIASNFAYSSGQRMQKIAALIAFPFLIGVGARGGFQLIPINESAAYYSSYEVNNQIATNNIWYLIHSFLDAYSARNPYKFMDDAKAAKITKKLFTMPTDSTVSILNTQRPNVVVIVLESWTANIIKALGGEKNVTPCFDTLRRQGLLFTHAYASGFRTDQALPSVFSGFPAQPNNSIITTPSKSEKLPHLDAVFLKEGYHTSFYYGGEIGFANMKSYLLDSHFEKIIDKKDFKSYQLNSKWGAHDQYVLGRQLKDLDKAKEPFFSVLLTLSTHEPFEVPMKTPFSGKNDLPDRFRKAAYYTDHCLGVYFAKASHQPWFKHTIFILTADHGHYLPLRSNMNFPAAKHMTMMIYGGALKKSFRGKTIDKITNQNDIPAILLAQLHKDYSAFKWSKDVLNPQVKGFAYYTNENVLGWIAPQQNFAYSFTAKKIIHFEPKTEKTLNDTLLTQAKAYLQTMYNQYLHY